MKCVHASGRNDVPVCNVLCFGRQPDVGHTLAAGARR